MRYQGILTIVCDKKTLNIPISSILYVIMDGNNALLHLSQGTTYQTRMTMAEIEPALGFGFLKVKRGCLVSVIAIHNITEKVNLVNGEELEFATRHKKEIVDQFHAKQKAIIQDYHQSVSLTSTEEYQSHYKLFDTLPIAFCDIEMIFDNEFNAVDWIFRYGNNALAELEKVPLDKIVGNTFSSLFPNMDFKWLKAYERTALFGETIKVVDYSPEIDTYLDIICFPTFKGHCGCILFDVAKINAYRKATDTEKATMLLLTHLLKTD